ncbi:hypothetical protein MKX01_008208 [Papaver californicum]|nr:hypothetical protein MKX01_008208 [Papaver californicum]
MPCAPLSKTFSDKGFGCLIFSSPFLSRAPKRLWCVAKPSVPADDLQEAIDYACGVGAADCDEIKPNGSCYNPDTVVANGSYALNSYWRKNKNNGGTCSFGRTAMISILTQKNEYQP